MKVIGICGSPRKGNTETLLIEALKGAKEIGADTELILLREKNIKFCRGCQEICGKTGKCSINDDMQDICDKLVKSDGIIIGTPNYYNMVSGILKNFIDRTVPLYWSEKLKNKNIGIIAVGGDGLKSIKGAVNNIKTFSEICGMKLVRKPLCVKASNAGEIIKNKKALKKARDLGIKVVKNIVGK